MERAEFFREARTDRTGPLDGVRPGQLRGAHAVFILGA